MQRRGSALPPAASTAQEAATPSATTTSSATATTTAASATGTPSHSLARTALAPANAAQPSSPATPANPNGAPSTGFTYNTYAPVAKFGSPDPFNVDLNAGSLTEGVQIDVPPGPAGAMPNITLAYNSAAVSEQHSPQGAAGWVGEGWSISLGSISWTERQVQPTCTTTCGNTWQSQWMLTDPFGTSTELIPPNVTTSTYYDDSNNWWCTTGNASSTPCPIQFRTARETYAKVYAYVGPLSLGAAPDYSPCFRAYLANGVMEEFGCTADALQYYPMLAGSLPGQTQRDLYYPINWLLDLITNPQGDQVHITYQSDTETAPDGLVYPRDTGLSTIEWDSPTCTNATQMCTSSAQPNQWAPLYRVQFAADHHLVSRLTNTPSGCNPDATVRCDDPVDLSASGGIRQPQVNGTMVLNDINVQTRSSSTSSTWNTVRNYQLSYEQSGPTTVTDPVTGRADSTAGYLDLTKIQQVGDDGATALPATTLSYSSQTQYYEDGSYTPYSATVCGPSWNTGGNGGTCDLWSQTYDGNSRYLATVNNGLGLQQTFSWADARNNTHGVNSGQGTDIANPLYCDGLSPSAQATYPCNSADDQAWSRTVVSQRTDSVLRLTQNGQGGQQSSTPVTSTSAYSYQLAYPLVAQECGDCVAGMYWGNQNDGDYLDYYNGHFMGFTQANVSNPDGSVVIHHYEPTEGWGVYDTSQVTSCPSTLPPVNSTCHNAPWWQVANAGHGLETEADSYDTNGTTLLKQETFQYQAICPPSGVTGTPAVAGWGNWGGKLVNEVDHNNPVADCDVQQTQSVATTYDGASGSGATSSVSTTYDSYGRVTQTTSSANGGGSGGNASPLSIVHKTSYIWDDGLAVPTSQQTNSNQEGLWGGLYLIDVEASSDTEDATTHTQSACAQSSYDGKGFATGQSSGLTQANATEQDRYSSCVASPTGKLSTTTTYDGWGNPLTSKDADANAGDTTHQGPSGTPCAGVSTCTQYDPTTQAKATLSGNALAQNTQTGYGTYGPGNGYGLWPLTTTDANNQTTSYTYDALGRLTSLVAPGQTGGPPTEQITYTNWCAGTSAQSPCVEQDTTQRLDANTTVTMRQFYDGDNRLVETRTAAPGGQDVVQYTFYDASGRSSASSVKYFVAAYTGPAGNAAYSIPDTSQVVTTMTYDGLGRTLTTTDPLSEVTQTAYSVVCNPSGLSDTGCYEQSLATDANSHRTGNLADAFGRAIYAQTYTGNSPSTYAVYTTTTNTYDTSARLVRTLHPNGTSTMTATYDTNGRLTQTSDPDRGTTTYNYDANGNLASQADARGASGTTYFGYDGLDRPLWRNTTNTSSGAYDTLTYDSTANGSAGLGRVSSEVFRATPGTGAASLSGAYLYAYDALGRVTRTDQTMASAGACPSGWTCQDIGSPALAGTQSYTGDGVWTIQGEGTDIWGTSDQFHFVSQSLSGDGSVSAHVSAQTMPGTYAKTGVMLRDGTSAGAANYLLQVQPARGMYFVTVRASAGASTTTQTQGSISLPVSIQVQRSGNTFSAAISADGVHWTPLAGSQVTLSLSSTLQAGVAVTSNNTGVMGTSTVDSLTTTTGSAGACPTSATGSWTCQDIGSPALAGTQSALGNGVWTVAGAGHDIWGTSDQFHFVSEAQSGDGSLSARITAQTTTGTYAKVGVMLRNDATAGSAEYNLQVDTNGLFYVVYRATAGGTSATAVSGSLSLPIDLQVTRTGSTFSAATSTDGSHWTPIAGAHVTISMNSSVRAGVAVCSNNVNAVSTALVDQVTDQTGAGWNAPASVTTGAAQPPSSVADYVTQQTYDDAGLPLATTDPTGEVATTSYTAQGWLAGLATTLNGTTTTLLGTVSYSGAGGATGQMTGATLGNGTTGVYTEAINYDALARATDTTLTRTSDGSTLYEQTRAYDAVGNVANLNTTLPTGAGTGTDNQAFCYDERNRLVWAGSVGTAPCTGVPVTAGTLSSAQYTQAYAYDTLDRLSNGALGASAYTDPNHLHAVTSMGTAYTASYDAAGNMTCRAPTSATTCSGTQTGAILSWDTEGRLAAWQNAPSAPTSTTQNLYDGAGNRVAQQITSAGGSTSITYVGGIEEVATSGSGTITTTYDAAGGKSIAEGVNGSISFLASDGLGSALVALDSNGNATASVLYGPYGSVRYTTGAMPGSRGFTNQRADSTTGLDEYGARYYDAVAGAFVSADTVDDGLNRYAYVHGNPETLTDPSGHMVTCGADCQGDGGTDTPPPTPTTNPPPSCTSGANCGGGGGGGGNGTPPPTNPPPTNPPPNTTSQGCSGNCASAVAISQRLSALDNGSAKWGIKLWWSWAWGIIPYLFAIEFDANQRWWDTAATTGTAALAILVVLLKQALPVGWDFTIDAVASVILLQAAVAANYSRNTCDGKGAYVVVSLYVVGYFGMGCVTSDL